MTMISEYRKETGTCRRVLREDAVKHEGHYICPTTQATKWVSDWAEFLAAGGSVCFNEDQTEIELLLPEPYKFGCRFNRKDA